MICARPMPLSLDRAPSPAAAATSSARKFPNASPKCARCQATSARPAVTRIGPAPRNQDPGAARDHRLAGPDLHQGRRLASLLRRGPRRDKVGADVVVVDGMQGGTPGGDAGVFDSSMSGSRRLRAFRPPCSRISMIARCSSSCRAVSAMAPMSPGPRRLALMPSRSAPRPLVALGEQLILALEAEYETLGSTAGYDDWHEGRDPAGASHAAPSSGGSIRFSPADALPTISRS